MTKSETEKKNKAKIIFEKLTIEEEKKVLGSGIPDDDCYSGPPTVFDC